MLTSFLCCFVHWKAKEVLQITTLPAHLLSILTAPSKKAIVIVLDEFDLFAGFGRGGRQMLLYCLRTSPTSPLASVVHPSHPANSSSSFLYSGRRPIHPPLPRLRRPLLPRRSCHRPHLPNRHSPPPRETRQVPVLAPDHPRLVGPPRRPVQERRGAEAGGCGTA